MEIVYHGIGHKSNADLGLLLNPATLSQKWISSLTVKVE